MYRQEPRYFEKLGARTEYFLENIFTRWGTFFATYPWLTLFGGASLVIMLGYGIVYVKITTDPVELWAAPSSKSRIEREYFDSKFEPFFRMEQVSKFTTRCFIISQLTSLKLKLNFVYSKGYNQSRGPSLHCA